MISQEVIGNIIAAIVPSMISAATLIILHKNTKKISKEVQTLNELSMGQLAAAEETRRIKTIPRDERTPKEQRHVDTAVDREK